ncbi:MAG: glyoxalase superfamily protein [Bacteroidota bacterium]|nr:glyoxalase superfamily protein [Bacteroidota bacterium]
MDSNKFIQGKLPIRVENIQPILTVKDMTVSRRFYKDILGFEEAGWGTDDFTSVSRDGSGIYLCRGGQGNPGTWIWIGFDGDMVKLYNELKAKGVTIRQPPVNHSWALELQIEDPDGHVLRLGTDPNYYESASDKES